MSAELTTGYTDHIFIEPERLQIRVLLATFLILLCMGISFDFYRCLRR
jgi:hypothetical protein